MTKKITFLIWRTSIISSILCIQNLFNPLAIAQVSHDASSVVTMPANINSLDSIKQQILQLAYSYKGQGDPDYSKQNQLNILVNQLLKISGQNAIQPLQQRLPLLAGAWQQVWGPYDYGNDKRGVDKRLNVEGIYQVVSPSGHYYNVNQNPTTSKITLLRGEYKVLNFLEQNSDKSLMAVQFTDLYKTNNRMIQLLEINNNLNAMNLWELPEFAENKTLNISKQLPSFLVRWFFGGGVLNEVYTDETMRIAYGANNLKDAKNNRNYIYILVRPNIFAQLKSKNF